MLKEVFTIGEHEPGTTGDLSPGKLIAWFWMIVVAYISLVFFGVVPHFREVAECDEIHITFWRWVMASFIFGTMSVGFYWGLAKGGYTALVEALKKRIEGNP